MSHYNEIFWLKSIAATSDVFHLLSGMWKTPVERCFMWLGGFRSSELLKVLEMLPITWDRWQLQWASLPLLRTSFTRFNIASRSAGGPPCGTRLVVGRIVKESYGATKQQHTFTIEVLWSKGEKSLPPLHPLLIKGRNLYRLKTMRQRWEDEGERQKILFEKHTRGSLARSSREARIQEKEMRKTLRENRALRTKDQNGHLVENKRKAS